MTWRPHASVTQAGSVNEAMPSWCVHVRQSVEPRQWNAFVREAPSGTIYQTTYWAEYLRAMGCRVWFVSAEDELGQLCGTLLMWAEPVWHRGLRGRRTPLSGWERCLPRQAFWNYGPLVAAEHASPQAMRAALMARAERVLLDERIIGIRSATLPLHGAPESCATVHAPSGLIPERYATFLVEVTAGPEGLWKSLGPSARKAVRKCHEQGVVVRRLRDGELGLYERLLQEGVARGTYPAPPHFPNTAMWSALRQNESCLEVFLAECEGRPLSGLGVLIFNGILFEIAVARGAAEAARRLPVQDAIKWEILCWAHREGHRLYDLGGVAPAPRNPKEDGIRRFKAKWGGRYTEHTVFRRDFSSVWAASRWLVRRLRGGTPASPAHDR